MKNLIKISILLSVISMSCEEQMIMIPAAPEVAEGRVMLLEDMTGVSCVPCFGAVAFLESVLEENEGSIVAYGVHGVIQSEPADGSKYDFRYEDAASLETDLNVIGKPAATFNRITLPNGKKVQINLSTWQAFIDAELVKPQVAELLVQSNYNSENRFVEIDLSLIPLEDISGEVNIHLVISESHLIDSQKSPDGEVLDFEHNHVYKKSLTGGLQGAFLASDLETGGNYRYTASYTVPEELNGEWIAENMEITAYVTSTDRDNEVQQAAQIHLTE